MLPLLLSGFGVPAATTHSSLAHASQNAAHATHCQQTAMTSAGEKSGVPEQDCCKDGTCICAFLTQTVLGNPAIAIGESLPVPRIFVPLQSPQLPAPVFANLLRPPIA